MAGTDAATTQEEREALSKLSIAELKRRLFWLGAALPQGGVEKGDLVDALLAAQVAQGRKAEPPPPGSATGTSGASKQAEAKAPAEPPKPLDPEQEAAEKARQEVIDMHLLSEEQLKQRILQAGGELPEGTPSKYFLIALLKSTLKWNATSEAQLQRQAQAPPPPPAPGAAVARPPPPPSAPPPQQPSVASTASRTSKLAEEAAGKKRRREGKAEGSKDGRAVAKNTAPSARQRRRAAGAAPVELAISDDDDDVVMGETRHVAVEVGEDLVDGDAVQAVEVAQEIADDEPKRAVAEEIIDDEPKEPVQVREDAVGETPQETKPEVSTPAPQVADEDVETWE